jgi:transporter family protein
MSTIPSWLPYALGSAFFATLTALFGKFGVAGMNSNMATLIRTTVILAVTASIVLSRSEWQPNSTVPRSNWTWLVLSGMATGLSWLCYYRALQLGPISMVAPVNKLSVAFPYCSAYSYWGTINLKSINWWRTHYFRHDHHYRLLNHPEYFP